MFRASSTADGVASGTALIEPAESPHPYENGPARAGPFGGGFVVR
jgi:hypothetical protein